ncbi:MAG: sigma-54-dependent transcriptional regulator [Porticoccaceae bacterium]
MKKTQHHILIVEDEEIIRNSLRKLLERNEFLVSEAVSVKAAQQAFNLNSFDLVISDLRLPGSAGTDLIKASGNVPVIIMTSYASLRSAVETMRQGAVDYISKPFDHDEMVNAVKRILEKPAKSTQQLNRLLMGDNSKMLAILRTVHKAAPTKAPVLIQGENGTGRRTVAEIIHADSGLGVQSFRNINCSSATAAELLDILDRENIGTLFLNNICELSPALQPYIVKLLQKKTPRIIASAEHNLPALVDKGRFRKDLYYSLNVVKIKVPTLSERVGDIPALINYFVKLYSTELGMEIVLTQDAIRALTNYSWPGNVQELQNTIYQAAILAEDGEQINTQMLGLSETPDHHTYEETSAAGHPAASIDGPAGLSLEDYFTSFVLENQENMSETALAQKLGISRKSLWERRNKLGISRKKA